MFWRVACSSLLLSSAVSGFLLPPPLSTLCLDPPSCVAISAESAPTKRAGSVGLNNDKRQRVSHRRRHPSTGAKAATIASPLQLSATSTPVEYDDFEAELDSLDGRQHVEAVEMYDAGDYDRANEETKAVPSSFNPVGDLDALDDLLGLHKVAEAGGDYDGDLDALDDLLRRDAEGGSGSREDEKRPLEDDGFGALDDLLGLDDGPRRVSSSGSSAPSTAASSIATCADEVVGDVNIDPYGDFDSPTGTDSLDDLLASAAEGSPSPRRNSAMPTRGRQPARAGASSSPPVLGASVDDSWLDDLLKADGNNVNPRAARADGGAGDDTRRRLSRSGRSAAAFTSWPDDSPGVRDLPSMDSQPAPSSKGTKARQNFAIPHSPESIDDWLGNLLNEDEAPTPKPRESRGRRGSDSSSGGSYSDNDLMTGSNALEGWKSQTAPARRNVMGRTHGAGRGGRGRQESGFGGFPSPGRGPGRGRDNDYEDARRSRYSWGSASGRSGARESADSFYQDKGGRGTGDSWGSAIGRSGAREFADSFYEDKGGHGSGGWKDRGGRSRDWDSGFDDDSGKWEGGRMDRGDGGYRQRDPSSEAQRAVSADLKMLGSRGRWEDAVRALVTARMRGVPVNEMIYNR